MKFRKFFRIVLAAICSFLFVNFLCMFYFSGLGSIRRSHGATATAGIPGSCHINLYEGCGVIRFDANGYPNPDGSLESTYVLMMGSSHLVASQIPQKLNMSTRLNYLLGGTDTSLKVYNIAHSGNYLPGVIKGFQAGIGEFPDSCAIIIECMRTSYAVSDLQESMRQTEYDPSSNGSYLAQNITAPQQLRSLAIGGIPFAKLMRLQLANIDLGIANPFGLLNMETEKAEEYDEKEYADVMNNIFSLLRDEYDKPIIILYHPAIALHNSTMEVIRDERTYDIFRNACENNNIIFVDTGDAFLKAYENEYIVPYGFANSVMGSGHLNADGHRIIADMLYPVLQDLQGVY